jgi:alkanesulfonate monooxygenase SsuD/methylene tetrahydromethanopterin reductase-like flavin-dependent oxidoreductase (luciferase family)
MRHKIDVLHEHCAAVGRDPSEIEFTGVKFTIQTRRPRPNASGARRWPQQDPLSDLEDDDTFWNGSPEELADRLRPYVEMGFQTVISEQPAPYDIETFERFIGAVKPLVDGG